jgi:RHS repeat-associated protein
VPHEREIAARRKSACSERIKGKELKGTGEDRPKYGVGRKRRAPIIKTVEIQRRFYDGDHVVLDFMQQEWTGLPKLEHRYLYGPAVDQVLAQEDIIDTGGPNPTYRPLWLLTDNQGTVRDVIDYAGGIIAGGHFQYDAYGQILEGDKELTRYLYTGRDFDATTGLQYNRARWYDSFTGRWTTQDPIGFAGGDYNLYRYVGNSPTNGTDPSGLIAAAAAAPWFGGAVGAAGAAGAAATAGAFVSAGYLGYQAGNGINWVFNNPGARLVDWWYGPVGCAADPRVTQAQEIQKEIDRFREIQEEAVQRGLSKDLIDKLGKAIDILEAQLRKLFE